MRWTEIKIDTTREAAEAVSALMMDQGCHGTAMAGTGPVSITGHLPVDDLVERRLLSIREGVRRLKDAGLNLGSGVISATVVEDQDWATAWRKFYKPMRIGERIVIKPSWEEFESRPGDVVVELDPGMAFGSGTHASTALCLQALEKIVKPGDFMLDIGTGSGILAIAAVKLGAAKVIATDDDSVAVEVATENARLNGVDNIMEARQADLLSTISERADIIVSNIIADVVIRLAPEIPNHLKPGGFWISAGIIDSRLEDVTEAIQKAGMRVIETHSQEEWVSVIASP